jgi:AraC family transcriptional regulator
MTSSPVPRLAFGEFYGRIVRRAELGGFSIQEIADAPPDGVPRHGHSEAHFCLVTRGDYQVSTVNFRGTCRRVALLFYPAGTMHQDQFSGPGSCVTVSIGAGLIEPDDSFRLPNRPMIIDDPLAVFTGLELRRELVSGGAFTRFALDSLAVELLARATTGRPASTHVRPGWLSLARDLLGDRAAVRRSVREVADAVGVHPVHLARVFRAHFGLSPGEYLRQARVEDALRLIEESTEPLATIAARCGFCDQSELTKAVRRALKTTPRAYRRALRHEASSQHRPPGVG